MSKKQLALLRDLAKFASKYKASDWQAALRLLSDAQEKSTKKAKVRSATRKIAGPSGSAVKKPSSKLGSGAVPSRARSATKPQSKQQTSLDAMLAKVPLRQLRFAYSRLFQEKKAPENRHQIILELKEHLGEMSEAARKETIFLLATPDDATENYRRWLKIISTPAKASKF